VVVCDTDDFVDELHEAKTIDTNVIAKIAAYLFAALNLFPDSFILTPNLSK
jgi:hypothetical protein